MAATPLIHVWNVLWCNGIPHWDRNWALLSSAEQAKAQAFRFEVDRQRYALSHAALRRILDHFLSLQPQAVPLTQAGLEKPLCPGVEFNLSHSGDYALVAVSAAFPVGVDVEQIKPDLNITELAARFFSPAESETLFHLPAAEQIDAFFRIWTRKEAFLKGRGDGLSLSLSSFDVSLEVASPSALLATRFDPAEATRWRVIDLPLPAGYCGALAVRGQEWQLNRHELTDWSS